MKYVAFLRGINVGGNNIIKMQVLKEAFEQAGYKQVKTYIQSGNVIFESNEKNTAKLTQRIEGMLTKTFNYNARVILRSHKQLVQTVEHVPSSWNTSNDIRCYIGFLSDAISVSDAEQEIVLNEAVDSVKILPGVVYMTTLMSGLTKSAFNKLVGKKVYKEMTIRNYNTTQKILSLM